ncbi:hypothetical protein GGR51DRAFT_508437 [Nemania sp. FL0031]|nr:hypothetical protein GGR51DRAFT_508437 [Nemania sp. FL0031]
MTPRFFTCSVPQCSKPSVRAAGGSCDSCNRYLCYTHMSPSFHKCEEIVDDAAYGAQISAEIENLRSRINEEAVRKLASGLNDGKSCSIEHSPVTGPGILMGCANYHARIRFHDGSPSWLIRIPRVTSCAVGFPVPLANYLIRSEYATLKFLETTAVPAPRAFGYGISGSEIEKDHGVGISFLLIEELPGRPWIGNGVSGNEATREEKEKIWGAAADILAELEKHPFPRAGSLCCEYSGIEVSAVASDRFVTLDPEGPFDTPTAYYKAFAAQYLELIADGQVYTQYPVDAYLVYRFLRDTAAVQLGQRDTEAQAPARFFLKHVDDKGDHLLVDENLNVTGIIDWQMARVVPRHEAFGASLVTADMNALCSGKISLSDADTALAKALRDRGSPELASCMADEKVRRFFWGLASEPKWSYALPLAEALLKIFGVSQDWTIWRETALKDYGDDERLQALVDQF